MEKILIIDDSAVQTNLLRSSLEGDYEITTVHTAQEGLAYAREGGFSLILLDIVMPGMDGFTLLKKLQEEIVTQHVPVILITGFSDIQSEEQGLMLGAVDYVAKPIHPPILKARIHTHIKLYQYQKRIEHMAMYDELTGVANRRYYDRYCVAKWQEAIRLGRSFSVCLFDIDKFKVYNDTYGHPAGDKVLAAVAGAVSSNLQRGTDFFARYGGEEFVAIVTDSAALPTFQHFQKIRQAVEDLHIPHEGGISPWVTVSVGGITIVPKKGDGYDTHLKIADAMLYDAKRYGRNQVVWSNERMEQWREK